VHDLLSVHLRRADSLSPSLTLILSSSSPTMSAFVAIKTTLSAAMAKRSTLLTRTKVFSRSRRPTVDVYNAHSSPWCVATRFLLDIIL
jgi:hypothetical protein